MVALFFSLYIEEESERNLSLYQVSKCCGKEHFKWISGNEDWTTCSINNLLGECGAVFSLWFLKLISFSFWPFFSSNSQHVDES